MPPLAAVNCWPISVKAAVSEAAANTLISPGVAAPEPPDSSPPQPASASAATASAAARRVRNWRMRPPLRLDWFERGGPGSSTTTLVALTAATASIPGASPSSSAASRVISDTTR